LIYSYNDPNFPANNWTVYSAENLDKIGGVAALKAINPLGYYAYNPIPKTINIASQTGDVASTEMAMAAGWHLVFWYGDSAMSKTALLENLSLTYSDGRTISAASAISEAFHQISPKIFVVMNEHSIDKATAIKELTNEDSATTVSKVPAKSYFWIYNRTTLAKLMKISFGGATGEPDVISAQEKAQIDAWLEAKNLTPCGDPAGTVYIGGNCLFDETTGKTWDKYLYLVAKFPAKPWQTAATPVPSLTAISACGLDKTYENSAGKSPGCVCPSGYAFKVLSMHWGPCNISGMTDCPTSTLQCIKQ